MRWNDMSEEIAKILHRGLFVPISMKLLWERLIQMEIDISNQLNQDMLEAIIENTGNPLIRMFPLENFPITRVWIYAQEQSILKDYESFEKFVHLMEQASDKEKSIKSSMENLMEFMFGSIIPRRFFI